MYNQASVYLYKNGHGKKIVRHEDFYKPRVSIIMPTYNKRNEVMMTLHSLQCQTFSKDEFEVIICDDGSTDQTSAIFEEYSFSFPILYIRSLKNIGRPSIRNLGVQAARGEIVIFLDAEIMVRPDFVEQHYQEHSKREKLVLSASLVLHGVYTLYHPAYNQEQLEQLRKVLHNHPSSPYKYEDLIKRDEPVKLLTEKEVYDGSFTRYAFEKPFVDIYRRTVFKHYGNEVKGFHFPWLLFCTGNISVRAEGIREVGLFEEYPGYGWDDHEMGYRLYKKGYTFLNAPNLISYHQEHPISPSNPMDAVGNFLRMFQKYPEVQMRIFVLHFFGVPFKALSNLAKSYRTLEQLYPHDYKAVKELFMHLLITCSIRLGNGEGLYHLLKGAKWDREMVEEQLKQLWRIKEIQPFVRLFQELVKDEVDLVELYGKEV